MRHILCLLTVLGSGAALVPGEVAAQSVLVEVAAGEVDRADVPVSVTLPETFEDAKAVYLQRLDTAQKVVAQRSSSEPATIFWMLQDRLPRGQSRRYRVLASNFSNPAEEVVTCRDAGSALTLGIGGRPVLTYHTAVVMPPSELDPVFQRSGFIHPVATPGGRIVTADFPADHAHQHGIFFAWKQAQFEGRPVDFWNQADKTGTVEHVAVNHFQSGPVFAEFNVTLRHLDLSAPDGPQPALDEDWTLRLYPRRDVYIFDLTSRQQCASGSPLTLLEYHYGGMGYRGPTAWLNSESGCRMLTSEGKGREEGNHSRPVWVDCTGELDGKPCGLRVIGHPSNFRYPQPVRLHPSKPYFVFAPEVLGEFQIEPGETYESRYRYVVFDGNLAPEAGDPLVQDYLTPPKVRIIQ